MKTLYVSDLDGTLLRSNQSTSQYRNQMINKMTENGMLFSYATARSIHTARKVTEGLNAEIPIIVYNGVFIMNSQTAEIMDAVYFDESVNVLLDDLFLHNIYPTVYLESNGWRLYHIMRQKQERSCG